MITNIMLIIGGLITLGVLGAIIFILFKYPHLPLIERLGLGLLASGLMWGGVDRVREASFGGGDVIMLLGIFITLWRFGVCNPRIGSIR